MNEAITAKTTLDSPTLLVGLKWYSRWASRPRWLYWLALGLTLAASTPLILSGELWTCWPYWCFLGLFLFPTLMKWAAKVRLLKASKSAPEEVAYTFREDGVSYQASGDPPPDKWSFFRDSFVTPDGCLLTTIKKGYLWLPTNSFASGADYTRFLDLLAAKTKHSKLG